MKRTLLIACSAVATAAGAAPKAHEHGVARLDVGVDPQRVTVLLELPQDSVLGYEREPRGDAERAAADAVLAKLKDAAALFRIDSAAQCTPARTTVEAPLLTGAQKAGTHEDVSASYEFSCKDGNRAGFVEASLFEAFPRLQRIDVQAATRKGQLKATLKRPVSRLPLVR